MVNINAWEVNTHRAINRVAITKTSNLNSFLENSGIKNTNYGSEIFEGYTNIITRHPITYFDYINKKYSNDGVSEWRQTFDGFIRNYQDLIEAGSILEDAVYDTVPLSFNGRFNNHFYEAQNNGHALTFGYGIRVNALKWGTNGAHVGAFFRENKYSYLNTLNYFLKGFTESSPTDRKKYQAKMLVGVGHLLHLMNDMTSPAHTRDDSHPLGDAMEVCGRGGESGNEHRGFRIEGNVIQDYLGILKSSGSITLPSIPKYSKFSDFISQESYWVSTHFFSNDTIFTKPLPSKNDTYEDFSEKKENIEKYYIKSYARDGVPLGTKLAIRVKSYIINALKEKYYKDDEISLKLGNSSVFQGDYTAIQDNARILIPRAIANARNFLDYFFRGQISAEITYTTIVVKNISDTSLVAKDATIMRSTHSSGGAYSFRYEDDDGTRHPLYFTYDRSAGNSDFNDNTTQPNSPTNVLYPTIDLDSGDSLEAHIILDDASKRIIRTKKIIAIYYGDIGQKHERGMAVCQVNNPQGVYATRD